jgi:hypothetical protein
MAVSQAAEDLIKAKLASFSTNELELIAGEQLEDVVSVIVKTFVAPRKVSAASTLADAINGAVVNFNKLDDALKLIATSELYNLKAEFEAAWAAKNGDGTLLSGIAFALAASKHLKTT